MIKVLLLGFVAVGILLFTNHWGVAMRITNYLFFVFALGVIYEIIFFKK